MSERVEYIRGRLDALEAAAKAADGKPWRVTDDEDDFDGDRLIMFRTLRSNEGSLIITDRDGYLTTEDLQHIALNDPAAVLARVEADRAILNEHPILPGFMDGRAYEICARCSDYAGPGVLARVAPGPCRTVRLMAEGLGWKDDGDE